MRAGPRRARGRDATPRAERTRPGRGGGRGVRRSGPRPRRSTPRGRRRPRRSGRAGAGGDRATRRRGEVGPPRFARSPDCPAARRDRPPRARPRHPALRDRPAVRRWGGRLRRSTRRGSRRPYSGVAPPLTRQRRRRPAGPGPRPSPLPPRIGVVGPLAGRRPRRRCRASGHRDPLAGPPSRLSTPELAERPLPVSLSLALRPMRCPECASPFPLDRQGQLRICPACRRAFLVTGRRLAPVSYDAELPPSAPGPDPRPRVEDPVRPRRPARRPGARLRRGGTRPVRRDGGGGGGGDGAGAARRPGLPSRRPKAREERHAGPARPPSRGLPDVRGGTGAGRIGLSRAPPRRGSRPRREAARIVRHASSSRRSGPGRWPVPPSAA